jgi:uncharacterized protein YodC (DUF2158 family)
MPFQEGDRVQLKCGGPIMVVYIVHIDPREGGTLHEYECCWWSASNELRQSIFKASVLGPA